MPQSIDEQKAIKGATASFLVPEYEGIGISDHGRMGIGLGVSSKSLVPIFIASLMCMAGAWYAYSVHRKLLNSTIDEIKSTLPLT